MSLQILYFFQFVPINNWQKQSCKAQCEGAEEEADRKSGGKTTLRSGQAWDLEIPKGQQRTGKDGDNWF